MCSNPEEGAAYLYNTYYSYRMVNNTFLIEYPNVIYTILHHFRYYNRLCGSFYELVFMARSKSVDTSYDIAVLGLYYSLPEFSYCFTERGEEVSNVEIPLHELRCKKSKSKGSESSTVAALQGDLVNEGKSTDVNWKVNTYFRELATKIELANHQTLRSIIQDMLFQPSPMYVAVRPESGIEIVILRFVERSCAILKLFEQDEYYRIKGYNQRHPMRQGEKNTKCKPDISYMNGPETVQPVECKLPSIVHIFDNNENRATSVNIRKQLAVQALLCGSNISILSDGINFAVLKFDFDNTSPDIHYRYFISNIGFTGFLGLSGNITPAQLIHSIVYHRWKEYIGQKQRGELENISKKFKTYLYKYTE